MIVSSSNSKIKLIRSLYSKKQRYKNKKYLVEGLQISKDYLKFSKNIDFALVSEDFDKVEELYNNGKNLEVYSTTNDIFDKISDTKNNQGIILVVDFEDYSIEDILTKNAIIVIDGIQDPGNLGTIIRTSDAFNIGGVITLENTADLYNNKTVRSSMGSIARIPVISAEENKTIIAKLKENKYNLLASTPRYKTKISNINKICKNALFIGNEAKGISKNVLKECDDFVGIEMKGDVESLNAAVAAGILICKLME